MSKKDKTAYQSLHGIVNLKEIASRRKPPRPPRTKTLEIRYYKTLQRSILYELKKQTKELLIPALNDLIELSKVNKPDRKDNAADEIQNLMSILRIQVNRNVPSGSYEKMATQAFDRTDNQSKKYMERLFKSVANVSYTVSEPWLSEQIKLFVNENVKLIKSIPDSYFERVEGVVTRGVRQGALTKDIAKDIQKAYSVTDNKAKLIARDQTSKLYGELQQVRQKSVGIESYVWSTSGDERVRSTHQANDGKTFSWDKPPATGHPGEDIQCRCVGIPIVKA